MYNERGIEKSGIIWRYVIYKWLLVCLIFPTVTILRLTMYSACNARACRVFTSSRLVWSEGRGWAGVGSRHGGVWRGVAWRRVASYGPVVAASILARVSKEERTLKDSAKSKFNKQ